MKNGRSVTNTLLAARLRWYLICTGRLMVRNWQWLVLTLVIVPYPVLLAIVSYPFITLLAPDVSMTMRLGLLVLLSALVALWVYPQREQILGKTFEPYFLTLPLRPLQVKVVDVATIFLATSLVLMPAFAAMLMSAELVQAQSFWRSVSLIVVVCVLLLSSYAVLRRRWYLLIVVFGANVLLAIALSVPDSTDWFAVLILALLVTIAGFLIDGYGPSRSISRALERADGRTIEPLQTRAWIGVALPWRILGENRSAVGLRLATVGVASGFAVAIQSAFDYDSRSLNVGISTVAFNAVMLSGVCRLFQQARCESYSYLAALPMRYSDSLFSEITCLSILAAPFTILLTVSLVYGGVMTVLHATLVTAAQLLLLTALHQVVTRTSRHAVVVGLLLGVGWAWIVMVAI